MVDLVQNARASKPSPRISNAVPVTSCARIVTYCGRRHNRESQEPKASLLFALLAFGMHDFGFAHTILASGFLPLLTSMTASRRLIRSAARRVPHPGGVHGLNMSATSACNSSPNLSIGLWVFQARITEFDNGMNIARPP